MSDSESIIEKVARALDPALWDDEGVTYQSRYQKVIDRRKVVSLARARQVTAIVVDACAEQVEVLVEVLPLLGAAAALDDDAQAMKLVSVMSETLGGLSTDIRALASPSTKG